MPYTVLRKIKRVDDRAGAPVPIESERELQYRRSEVREPQAVSSTRELQIEKRY